MLVRIFAVARGVSDVRWLEELTHAEDEPAADKAREDKYSMYQETSSPRLAIYAAWVG